MSNTTKSTWNYKQDTANSIRFVRGNVALRVEIILDEGTISAKDKKFAKLICEALNNHTLLANVEIPQSILE